MAHLELYDIAVKMIQVLTSSVMYCYIHVLVGIRYKGLFFLY